MGYVQDVPVSVEEGIFRDAGGCEVIAVEGHSDIAPIIDPIELYHRCGEFATIVYLLTQNLTASGVWMPFFYLLPL
jgi:hypothetical protein